jgi:hypothetical protein
MNSNNSNPDELVPENPEDGPKNEAEKVNILLLTKNEALFIDDNLSLMIEEEIGSGATSTVRPLLHTAQVPAPMELLEKIGKAILFTTDLENHEEPASVPVAEIELYMLREIAHSSAYVGEESVGINLKRKIFSLLYSTEYERDKVVKRMVAQLEIPLGSFDAS